MRKILVVRPGALGDTILTVPALAALRAAYPNARVVFAGNRSAARLLAPRYVDVALALDDPRLAPLFSRELPLREDDLLQAIDLAVLWLRDSDLIADRLRQHGTLVFASPSQPPGGLHVADYLLDSIRPALGVAAKLDVVPSLAPPDDDMVFARNLRDRLGPRPVAALHAGSGGKWKRWPANRFAELATALQHAAMTVLLIVGPADDEVSRAVLKDLAGHEPVAISGLTNGQLAALLALCALVVGNDSGVSHLAAAVGAPTVAIYGATDPAVWGIRGRQVAWVQGRSLQEIGVGELLHEALRLVQAES